MADESQHSTDLNVSDASERIGALSDGVAIEAFASGDDRKGVRDAVEARLAELGTTQTTGALRLSAADDSRSSPGKPLEAGGQGKATVRTRYPVDRFEHGIDGVPVITAYGVEVERGHVKKLLEAAAQNSIGLDEVEADS